MTSRILLIFASAIVFSCNQSIQESSVFYLKIKGSESMHEAFEALKYDFESIQDTIIIAIAGGGSRTGLNAIKDRDANIGLSSFRFNIDSIFGPNHGVTEYLVAYDGIVVVTNSSNTITQLTNDQISGIFSGRITDWSEIGGNPGAITPIFRDQNSGTQRFFTEYFGIKSLASHGRVASDNSEIVNLIERDRHAIGFIGFSYFAESINSLPIESEGSNFVSPTFANLRNNSYPLKRPLQIYYREGGEPAVAAFLDYINTERAQAVFKMHGLMPLRKQAY